ncbi:hypothetical protein BC940DRAFT_311738 [Gongronella butleri]|nr:hypothetical protein BC940DRAFT_311738 [Gongronella butleri]
MPPAKIQKISGIKITGVKVKEMIHKICGECGCRVAWRRNHRLGRAYVSFASRNQPYCTRCKRDSPKLKQTFIFSFDAYDPATNQIDSYKVYDLPARRWLGMNVDEFVELMKDDDEVIERLDTLLVGMVCDVDCTIDKDNTVRRIKSVQVDGACSIKEELKNEAFDTQELGFSL